MDNRPFVLCLDDLLRISPTLGPGRVKELRGHFTSVRHIVERFRSYKAWSDRDQRFRVLSFEHFKHWINDLVFWGSSVSVGLNESKLEDLGMNSHERPDPMALAECSAVLTFLCDLAVQEVRHWQQPEQVNQLLKQLDDALKWTIETAYNIACPVQKDDMFQLWFALWQLSKVTADAQLIVMAELAEALKDNLDIDKLDQMNQLEKATQSESLGASGVSTSCGDVDFKLMMHKLDAALLERFSCLQFFEPLSFAPVPGARSRNGATKVITQSQQSQGRSDCFFAKVTLCEPDRRTFQKLHVETAWLQKFRQRRDGYKSQLMSMCFLFF